jgi:hypothetical protein
MVKKLLLLPIMFICMMFAAFAYTIVDYDDILYNANDTALNAYGWINKSYWDALSYCSANGNYLECAHSPYGNNEIWKTFNRISDSYCLSENWTFGGQPVNISQRFTVAATYIVPTTANYRIIGLNIGGGHIRVYGNSSGLTKICVNNGDSYGGGLESCPYTAPAINTGTHNVQADYEMYKAGSGIAMGNITVYVDGNASLRFDVPVVPSGLCVNATRIIFKGYTGGITAGLRIWNMTTIVYNTTDTFLNANASINYGGNGTLPQCSDGLDNDADGYTDMTDPECSTPTQNYETPPNRHECNDGVDNDGDGFIDYPDDPACASEFGNTEYPQNKFMCNDGVDNDADGLIDMADPDCTALNGTEYRKQGTIQSQDTCSPTSLCLLKDAFIYNDEINWHNWSYYRNDTTYLNTTITQCRNNQYASGCDLEPEFLSGSSYGLPLAQSDYDASIAIGTQFKNITRAFTNTNTQNNIMAKYVFYVDTNGVETNSVIETKLKSTDDKVRIKLILNSTMTTGSGYVHSGKEYRKVISIYASSSGLYSFVGNAYLDGGSFEVYATLSQTNNSFSISWKDGTSATNAWTNGIYYYFDNNGFADTVQINSNITQTGFWLDEINVYGITSGTTASCSVFSPPKYLYEEFNYGSLETCGWKTNRDVIVLGNLEIKNEDEQTEIYKSLSKLGLPVSIKSTESRFVTLSFDEFIDSQSTSTNTNYVYMMDDKANTILTLYFDTGTGSYGRVWSTPSGTPELITSLITTDTYHNIKVVVDLVADKYNVLIDNTLFATEVPFNDAGFNFENVRFVGINSENSQYKMDNVAVYTSDANGQTTLNAPTVDLLDSNSTYLFGLMFKESHTCITDADCESGSCTKWAKQCTLINYRQIDDYGYNRTVWGFVKGLFRGGLEWFVQLIFDNMLLFIGFLIIMMFILYFFSKIGR